MLAIAGLIMTMCFWGLIALVGYIEGGWMALAVAAPFLLLYRLGGRWLDDWSGGSGNDSNLSVFQQPLAKSGSAVRRQLPG